MLKIWKEAKGLQEINLIVVLGFVILGPIMASIQREITVVYIQLIIPVFMFISFGLFLSEVYTHEAPLMKYEMDWDYVIRKLTYSRQERIFLLISMILYWVLILGITSIP